MSTSKIMVTVPTVRFVKCPKCLKFLTEFAEIPVYMCGGCGAILRAKDRTSSGQNLSIVSANPGCQNLPGIDPLSNELASPGQHTPASDAPGALEQVVLKDLNVSDSNGPNVCKESFRHEQHGIRNLEVSDTDSKACEDKWESSGLEGTRIQDHIIDGEQHEQHGIRNLEVSDTDCKACEDKWEPSGLEGTRIQDHIIDGEHPIEGNQAGNEEREISHSIKQEANDSFKSSNKLEEFSESMEHGAISEEDMIHMELENGNKFRMNTGSSHAYNGSASSTDEGRLDHIPRKYPLYSRRTFRNKNFSNSFDSTKVGENFMRKSSNERLTVASMGHDQSIEGEASLASRDFQQNSMEMDNGGSSSYSTRDTELNDKLRFSEQEDNVHASRKIDELKKELRGFFNKAAYHKGLSLLDVKATDFHGKVPPKQCRSSLISFPIQPNSSNLQCYPVTSCCHNGHCRPCPHNVCCHLPETTCRSLHIENGPHVFQDPRNMQFKDFKPQTIRHCRSVSGGAPFVICSKCFKLLQLPADFLVLPRRVHKLRCGSCSQVLLFYFRPRPHSMTQTPAEVRHPPSEENECDADEVDETSAPQSKELTCWNPTSISGDYFEKNKSSNAETSLDMSRSSDDVVEEEQSGSKQMKGLPLHNLMGYASASEVFFHTSYSDGYQSTEPDSNIYRPLERNMG